MRLSRYTVVVGFSIAAVAYHLLYSGEPLHWLSAGVLDATSQQILALRVPRCLVVILLGGTLASVGATYQVLFRNPLADPYLLGISCAVTLGAATAEVLFHQDPFSPFGFICGLGAALILTVLLVRLGTRSRSGALERLVLFGIGVNFVLSALLFLLLSYQAQSLGGGSLRWLFGQVSWPSFGEVSVLGAVVVLGIVALWLLGPYLDVLSLGDATARSLGVEAGKVRAVVLTLSSLLVAACVVYAGAVGFVGLIVPHLARMVFAPRSTRGSIVGSFFLGAILLVGADGLSRSIAPPMEFPIGVITTVLGGPVFIALLWRRG